MIIYLTIFPAIALVVIVIGLVKPTKLAPPAFEGCYAVDQGPTIQLDAKQFIVTDSHQPPRTVSYIFTNAYDIYVSGPSFIYKTDLSKRRVIVTGHDNGQIIHMLSTPRNGPQMLVPTDSGLVEVHRSSCSTLLTAKPPV